MAPERRRQVEDLFHQAMELEPTSRHAWLREACGADDTLRSEVEALLALDEPARDFIETPALQVAARQLAGDPLRLKAGQMVDRYRVQSLLGAGGLGIVYSARDPKLERAVALKFLHEERTGDPAMLERFRREARVLSALNHPNICAVYDIAEADGRIFIVMEYVPGKTLEEWIGSRGLRVLEVIKYASQIAEGMAKAHDAGIVHRDLKPSNIMVTDTGQVKILDFGIAKLSRPSSMGDTTATLTAMAGGQTEEGAIVGTLAYLSPEQAEGKPTDARSDIFAFGAVLYEMITGVKAFRRNSRAATLAAILNEDPKPIRDFVPLVPVELEKVVARCVRKDPETRLRSMADLSLALRELKDDSASVGFQASAAAAPQPRPKRALPYLAAAAATLIVATAAVLSWGLFRGPALSRQSIRRQLTFTGDATWPAISPDGKSVVYVTGRPGEQRLMVQDLNGGPALEVFQARTMVRPRWSPDGSEIAVGALTAPRSRTDVMLVPRLGGSARRLGPGAFACWSPDGNRLATSYLTPDTLRIVDRASGRSRGVSLPGFRWLSEVEWSPKSNLIALGATMENGSETIWTLQPDSEKLEKVLEQDLDTIEWSVGDEIYFLHHTAGDQTATLSRIAIDPRSGRARAASLPLITGLEAGNGIGVSADGRRFTYAKVQSHSNLWLVDLQGQNGEQKRPSALTHGTAKLRSLSISANGQWLAFAKGPFLFKMPIEGGTPTQLTFSDHTPLGTAWSPDDTQIAFGVREAGAHSVWLVGADGANPRRLANANLDIVSAWWPNRWILYQKSGNRNQSMLDPETGNEKPLVPPESVGWIFSPKYSADGKKIAFFWNRITETGLWVISTIDGSAAVLSRGELTPIGWSPDGRAVFATRSGGATVTSVPSNGGDPRTIATLAGVILQAVSTPDGTKAVCNVEEKSSDIWLVENFDSRR